MNRSSFFRIHDVVRFIEDVFGERQSLEIEGGDTIIRNDGRRAEDVISVRTFFESFPSDIVFAMNLLTGADEVYKTERQKAALSRLQRLFVDHQRFAVGAISSVG